MAKRFTDTGKWAKANFRALPLKLKCVWMFLCDNCDHAGVWDVDVELMAFQLGAPVTKEEILSVFKDRIRVLSETKWLIPAFLDFQYGKLNHDNNVHRSVIQRLENLGAHEPLTSPSQGAKDKEKDKEEEKEKEKKGEKRKFRDADFEPIYATYPRKRGKAAGLRSCAKKIQTPEAFEKLRLAVERFAQDAKKNGTEQRYLPYFSTFMGEEDQWKDWIPEADAPPVVTRESMVRIEKELSPGEFDATAVPLSRLPIYLAKGWIQAKEAPS